MVENLLILDNMLAAATLIAAAAYIREESRGGTL